MTKGKESPLFYLSSIPKIGGELTTERPDIAAFSVKTEYFNYTGHVVIVGQRSGFRVPVVPKVHPYRYDFMVRVTYQISGDIKNHLHQLLSVQTTGWTKESELLKTAYRTAMQTGHPNRGVTFYLDYALSMDTLIDKGGHLYLVDLDVTVSATNDVNTVPLHPHSPERLNRLAFPFTTEHAYGVNYEIVDARDQFGDRWVAINGTVLKIAKHATPGKHDGLYIAYKGAWDTVTKTAKTHVQRIPLEEVDALTFIYANEHEARLNPTDETKLTLAFKQLEIESRTKVAELGVEKIKTERALFETSAKVRDLEQELDRVKLNKSIEFEEINRDRLLAEKDKVDLKDKYERRAIRRKDLVELLKFGPTLVVTGWAIYQAISKVRKG